MEVSGEGGPVAGSCVTIAEPCDHSYIRGELVHLVSLKVPVNIPENVKEKPNCFGFGRSSVQILARRYVSWFRFSWFSSVHHVQTGYGPTQPLIQEVPRALSLRIKLPGREADISSQILPRRSCIMIIFVIFLGPSCPDRLWGLPSLLSRR
jgi:hypothetical protein